MENMTDQDSALFGDINKQETNQELQAVRCKMISYIFLFW